MSKTNPAHGGEGEGEGHREGDVESGRGYAGAHPAAAPQAYSGYGGTYAAPPSAPASGPPAGYGPAALSEDVQRQQYQQQRYVAYQQQQPYVRTYQQQPDGVVYVQIEEEDDSCARVGCIFSWIPLVGWITYCANMSTAVPGSSRWRLARTAGVVATIVFLINVIIIISLRDDDDD